jgi:hypothetical protein
VLYQIAIYAPFESESDALVEHPERLGQKQFREIMRQCYQAGRERLERRGTPLEPHSLLAETIKGLERRGFTLMRPGRHYMLCSLSMTRDHRQGAAH